MAQKKTLRMSRIFPDPRIPQHKQPLDYPAHQRQTNPHIGGVSSLLCKEGVLSGYIAKFSAESPREVTEADLLESSEEHSTKQRGRVDYQRQLRGWNPHDDPHSRASNPYKNLFVGRLSYDVDEVELTKHFIKFGEIENIRIVKDTKTGKSRGYGFVTFKNESSVQKACQQLGPHSAYTINNRPIVVDVERARTMNFFKPRRLGGGLGGRGYMEKHNWQKQVQKMRENHRKQIEENKKQTK